MTNLLECLFLALKFESKAKSYLSGARVTEKHIMLLLIVYTQFHMVFNRPNKLDCFPLQPSLMLARKAKAYLSKPVCQMAVPC